MASTELEELNNAPTPENNVVQYCELTTVGRKRADGEEGTWMDENSIFICRNGILDGDYIFKRWKTVFRSQKKG